MSKILVITFLLIWSSLVCAQAPISVTVVGDADYFPYSYLENEKAKGIYPELLTAVFAKMPEYTVNIEMLPWKRGLALVENHQRVAIFPPYKRLENRPWLNVLSEPLMDEQIVVICRKDSVKLADLKSFPQDYQGLEFGNNLGFLAPGPAFFDLVTAGKISVTESPSTLTNLERMRDGLIDCYCNDRLAIAAEAKRVIGRSGGTDFRHTFFETAVISTEPAYLGFAEGSEAKYSYRDKFLASFNQELLAAKKSGLIDKVLSDLGYDAAP